MLDRTDDISIAAENWLAQFEARARQTRRRPAETLFHPDSYWRDVLALSWNMQTINGARRDPARVEGPRRPRRARAVCASIPIAPRRARVTRAGTSSIEAIFRFETAAGRGNGILRLTPDAGDGNR